MRSTHTAARVVLAAALVVLATDKMVAAAVQVARDEAGLTVSATGERIEKVLEQLAAAGGFTVTMQQGIERRPVDVDVRGATVEEALRAVLRGRNYVIAYDQTATGLAVSRVEVMLPRRFGEPEDTPTQRAALRVARQRDQMRRKQDATLERVERTRAAQRAQRQAAQQARALAQAQQQQVEEPVPLRRLLWGRSR